MAPYVLSEQEGFYRGPETHRARAALTTIGGFSAIRGLVLGFVARPEAVCARRAVGVRSFAVRSDLRRTAAISRPTAA